MTAEQQGVSSATAGGQKLCFAPCAGTTGGLVSRCALPWGHKGPHSADVVQPDGVLPATAGGASAPGPIEQMIRHLSETYRQVTGFYPFGGTLGQAQCDGCYSFDLDGEHDDTCPNRHEKPAGTPDPRDAETERLRGELDKANSGWETWREEQRARDKRRDNELRVVAERLHGLVGDTRPCTMDPVSARHLHSLLNRVVPEPSPEIERLKLRVDDLIEAARIKEQRAFDAYAELLNPIKKVFGESPVGASHYRELREGIDGLIGKIEHWQGIAETRGAQVENFAHTIRELTTELDRLRAERDGQRADKEQAEAAHDRLRADLARERAIYADSPDDRLYHAADNTWWRRNDNGWLVEAERPQLADITAERDQLRRKLDQHLADENSAQAVSDRLRQELDLQHADRLRWLCEALNVNPANETWLTAMRRVRHLRQNFSDSPRCEVAESDGWRCRLFAGHDGKHLAQMPTGERREWPFDNRLTPRYWRVGDPEPEIGTTVRYVNHATWPTQTRRTDGQWHCNADTHDPSTCTESELYSWEQITARSELMPLVEVAANSKAGA